MVDDVASDVPGTDEVAVAPGFVDVVVDERVVDFTVVEVVDVDRLVDVARGAVVVVGRGGLVVVVRPTVGAGPVGVFTLDETDAGRTSR